MKVTTAWCDWCRKMIEEGEYFYISSPDELDEPKAEIERLKGRKSSGQDPLEVHR